jgi:hypothetical protein
VYILGFWSTRQVKGGKLMTHRRSRLSAAQRRTLEALAVDVARITPHTSATWPVQVGPSILTRAR